MCEFMYSYISCRNNAGSLISSMCQDSYTCVNAKGQTSVIHNTHAESLFNGPCKFKCSSILLNLNADIRLPIDCYFYPAINTMLFSSDLNVHDIIGKYRLIFMHHTCHCYL